MKVLVTGSSGGIGKAICELFLDLNYDVVGLDIADPVITDRSKFTHYYADVSNYYSLPTISDVNILINNAGVQNTGRDIDVNLKGVINCTEKYGIGFGVKSIVNMASISAHTGAEFPEYAASKGGVLAYTKNTAMRVAKYGTTCNSISAGGVITELNSHIISDPELYDAVLNETLLGKWALPQEIADLVYFLAVTNISITGQDIIIDNGEFAKYNFIW